MESASELRARARSELIAAALRPGGEVRLRVRGASMIPAVWPGDVLTVRDADASSLSIGGMAVFVRDGRLLTHRVVGRVHDSEGTLNVVTRGDTTAACDIPVAPSELLGSVVAVVRNGRSVTARALKPSAPMRLFALMMRHADPLRRLILKVHAARRRLREGRGWRLAW